MRRHFGANEPLLRFLLGRDAIRRLPALIALALLPLAVLALCLTLMYLREQRAAPGQALLQWSKSGAQDAAQFVAETEAFLSDLAQELAPAIADREVARSLLEQRLRLYPEYDYLWVTTVDGWTQVDSRAPAGSSPRYDGDRPYFQQAMVTGNLAFQTIVVRSGGERHSLVIVGLPIKAPDGTIMGVLGVCFEPNSVASLQQVFTLPARATLEIVDAQGTIIFDSARRQRRTGASLTGPAARALLGRSGVVWEGLYLGQPALVASSAVPEAPWQAVVSAPTSRAFSDWERWLLLWSAVVIGAVGISAYLGRQATVLGRAGWRERDRCAALARAAEERAAQMQAAREDLHIMLSQLPNLVIVFGADYYIRLSNEVANRYFGRDLVGLPFLEVSQQYVFLLPDGTPFPPQQFPVARAMGGERVDALEMRVHFPDGRDIDFLVNTAPLYSADGDAQVRGVALTATDITPLREAEAERERLLAEVEGVRRNLQTILEVLPAMVAVVDTNLRITFCNQAVRQALGRDLTGLGVAEVVQWYRFAMHSDSLAVADLNVLDAAFGGETITNIEARVTPTDLPAADLLVSLAPLRGADGSVQAIVAAAADITAQKRAQAERDRLLAEVRAAQENLRTIVDRMPQFVMVIDENLRVALINDVVRAAGGGRVLGRPLRAVCALGDTRHANGEPFGPGENPIERAFRGEDVRNAEVSIRWPDGRRGEFLESASPLRGPGDRIRGVVVALTDISPQKAAQAERERLLAEVEAAREELRTIIDRLPEGVLVVDPQHIVRLTNETVRRWVGRDPVGIPAESFWREVDYRTAAGQPFPPGQTPLERALRGETVIGVEVSGSRPEIGTIDQLESVAPLRHSDGSVRAAVVVLTDITPIKQLDRAKDEFISVAAHELRTPLTSLKGHAQILLRRAAQTNWSGEELRSLRTIDDQVDRLNELIGRLLDVSRIRLGRLQLHPEPVDLVALVRQVCEELQVTTEAHSLVFTPMVSELVGDWDAAALRQVLTNLVGNAIRHTDGGCIEARVWPAHGQAVVSVSDQGPGIPPERVEQLFEAFTPAAAAEHRRAGGLGLGLYISRGIVEAHGGCIWVESKEGVGTTFTFSLPRVRRDVMRVA